jgi:hypothetical protein
MKRPLIGGKNFHIFHETRRISSKKGHGKNVREFFFILCFLWKRRIMSA